MYPQMINVATMSAACYNIYPHEGAEVEKCVTYQAFQVVLNLMKGPIEHHLIKRYEVSLWDTFLLIHANLPQVM